eukprot:2602144-Prorocentrum_lima.AAC.1
MLYHWGLGIGKGVRLAKRSMPHQGVLCHLRAEVLGGGGEAQGCQSGQLSDKKRSHLCMLLRKLCVCPEWGDWAGT